VKIIRTEMKLNWNNIKRKKTKVNIENEIEKYWKF